MSSGLGRRPARGGVSPSVMPHAARSGARAGPVPFGRGFHDPCDASKIRWLKTTKRYESVTYPFRGLVGGPNDSGERLAAAWGGGRAAGHSHAHGARCRYENRRNAKR
jgi:hypothetical protein